MLKNKAVMVAVILAIIAVFVVVASTSVFNHDSKERYGEVAPQAPSTNEESAVAPASVKDEMTEPLAQNDAGGMNETVTEHMEDVQEAVPEAVIEDEVVPAEPASDAVQATKEKVEDMMAESETVQAVQDKVDEVKEAVAAGASGGLYNVVDGNKLDAFSYEGFKLFRNWCARCHGTYGQGMVGPNLAESLNVISKEQFVDTVTHGKTGQIGSMPAWESNDSVMKGMDNLYAYLKARADGAIGEVKPKKQ